MERRFRNDPKLQTRYIEFMDDYVKLGHMSELSVTENQRINYLPHHAITKEASATTKLRVVFDASSPTTSGKSLNEFLLCILWRVDPEVAPVTYSLNTVTYGLASAPFLAIRSLQQLSADHEKTHPRAAAVISRDFYVDDMITGADSIQQLHEIKTRVTDILVTAGFELTKFQSNVSLSQEDCLDSYEITDAKVLGLQWQSKEDVLRYEATCSTMPETLTKRNILSSITQIFDPLGLVGPVTIKAKMLMQSLWQLKVEWDTPIPETLRFAWSSYYQQLPIINQLATPRHAIPRNPIDIQLHGFCNASQSAYGACIFVRAVDSTGLVHVQLTAKSRVAPLKTISLPRLELCGAVTLSNSTQQVSQALTCPISKHYLWTDSEIALAWIQGEPSQWQIFVGNRVTEIQRLTSKQDWAHVRSEHNPADLISRGALPEQLINAPLWWEGPPWLKMDTTSWPTPSRHRTTEVPEARTQSFTILNNENSLDLFNRYSSLTKLKRVIATCLRFKMNCMLSRSASQLLHGPLTAEELQRATIVLIKWHQQEAFARELHHLRRNDTIDSHNRILSLNPMLDQDGIIRVGGRLRNAPLSYTQKHPIILSSNTTLTDLIIRDQHLKHFHMGPQLLLTTLHETYWIVHAKNAIKRVLKTCVLCFRLRPRSKTQLMGDMPASRITPSRAFRHTGVDYAGPFNIKISRNKSSKAYLCLFVCMATKAVHIELVSDLTTETFLNALKRFISRRGICESIVSDNGRNFVGANNLMRQVGEFLSHPEHQARITDFASNQGIAWKFIPPHSPHMGGLWEANIKAVKTHLRIVINDTLLSFEELYTVLVQIEAILNSRPLCPFSDSPDQLDVLTPGHFLIGTSLLALPEASVLRIPVSRTNRYQLVAQIQQAFWKRWSREYVTQMQRRTKWKIPCRIMRYR